MEKYIGKPLTFRLPSGYDITIREQNGDDDEILSEIDPQNRSQENNIQNYNKFIAGIVIGNTLTGKDFMTTEEVEALKLNDKYYILLKSRMHSLGNEVKFSWECQQCGVTTNYRDDISELDRDLTITPLQERKNPDAVFPYKRGNDTHFEGVLSSGKKIRFKYMDGKSELFILEQGKTKLSKNTDLQSRELNLEDGGVFQKTALSSYNVFSPKDMSEIRGLVKANDPQFNLVTDCQCSGCKSVQSLPYIVIKDFFFPTEI